MATSHTQSTAATPTGDMDSTHPRTVLTRIVTDYIDVDGDGWMDYHVYDEIAATSINTVDHVGEVA